MLTEGEIESLCYWAGPDANHEALVILVESICERVIAQVTS